MWVSRHGHLLIPAHSLVELIVLNIGLQAHILDQKVFSMFVIMAVVLTFVTTPLTLWVYPVRFHVKVGDVKGADGLSVRPPTTFKPAVPEIGGTEGRQTTTRFMVVLQKIEHLSAVMLLSQLLGPAPVTRSVPDLTAPLTMVSSLASTSEGDNGGKDHSRVSSNIEAPPRLFPGLPKGAPITSKLTFDALRLVELTGRTFSVMQSIETEIMAKRDDILQLFRQFGRLHGFNVNTSVSVVSQDQFPDSVTSYARESNTEMVIIPWTTSGGDNGVSEAMMDDAAAVTSSSAPINPFDSIFGSDSHTSPLYSAFIRQVFNDCPADVALFIDRGFGAADMNTGGGQHVLLPFFGGADDRLALSIVYQLCAHPNVTATVIRMDTTEGAVSFPIVSEAKEEMLQAHQTAMDANPLNSVSSGRACRMTLNGI